MKLRIGRHKITDMNQSRGGPVEADDTRASLAADGIGRETIAIVDIVDVDLLPFHNVGRLHEQRINRDAAFIMQTRVRHGRAVNL